LVAIAGLGDHDQVGVFVDQSFEPGADYQVIIDEEDACRHGVVLGCEWIDDPRERFKELGRRYVQGVQELEKGLEPWILPLTRFQMTNVRSGYARLICQRLLRETTQIPKVAQSVAEYRVGILLISGHAHPFVVSHRQLPIVAGWI
jgi:hypothetical protein